MTEQDTDNLKARIEELESQLAKVTAERDEWRASSRRHHPNPADHRYWEGRYRDEKARADAAEAAISRAYRMGLEDAATVMDYRAYGCRITVGMDSQGQCEGGAEDIRAIPTPTDLVERAMKKTGE